MREVGCTCALPHGSAVLVVKAPEISPGEVRVGRDEGTLHSLNEHAWLVRVLVDQAEENRAVVCFECPRFLSETKIVPMRLRAPRETQKRPNVEPRLEVALRLQISASQPALTKVKRGIQTCRHTGRCATKRA